MIDKAVQPKSNEPAANRMRELETEKQDAYRLGYECGSRAAYGVAQERVRELEQALSSERERADLFLVQQGYQQARAERAEELCRRAGVDLPCKEGEILKLQAVVEAAREHQKRSVSCSCVVCRALDALNQPQERKTP